MKECSMCGHEVVDDDLGTCQGCTELLDECADLKLGTAQDQMEPAQ